MAEFSTDATKVGLTKRVYGEKLIDLSDYIKGLGIISQMVPFTNEAKLGDTYNFPVQVTLEQGATYGGTTGTTASLNTAIAGETANAQLQGCDLTMRARIGYKLMEEAQSKGPQAFERATRLVLENLMDSAAKRRELSLLRGQLGLGQVETNTSGALVITAASWSAATWADTEKAVLEAFTTQAASATQHNTDLTVSAVDFDTRTITVTGTSSAVVANDYLYFKGARTTTGWNECAGLVKIFGTTSGTLMNISMDSYSRWKPNVLSSIGAFNMRQMLKGLTKPAQRGAKGDMEVLMPAITYEELNSDLSGARRYDGSYSRGKGLNGFESLEFYGQTGASKIQVHPLLWDSECIAFPKKTLKRVGATDLKFMNGKEGAEDIFFTLESVAAEEARVYMDQAIVDERPSFALYYSGITHT